MSDPRIMFVAPSAYPLGGVATWLAYLLPGLALQGWRPVLGLVSGRLHDADAYAAAFPHLESQAIPNPTGSHEGRIRAITLAIRKLRPSLVLGVNIPDTYSAVARLRLANRKEPRVAMTIHGIQPDLFDDVARFRESLDAVICTNQLTSMLVREEGIDRARVHYASYGVTLESHLKGARVSNARLRLAFVGRMDQWQKRVNDLPKIADALVQRGIDFELLIAGTGPDESHLRQALAAQQAAGRVRFLGALTEAELIRDVYQKADVLLLTSSWETGPIVLWEAMAHGVAIVSSCYIGSGREGALRDGVNCLLFPIGEHELAADCIARLVDGDLRRSIVSQATALVTHRYTRAASVDAWDSCLRRTLESPPVVVAQDPMRVRSAGRLDHFAGTHWGETLRSWGGRRHQHTAPGGEWPHSYGVRDMDDADFWARAAELDGAVSC